MKANLILTAALAATLFAACGSDDTVQQPVDNTPVAARFTAGISATRSTNDEWEAKDAIGIYMLEAGTKNVAEGAANRHHVTASSIGRFDPADDAQTIYFPTKAGAKVDFVAYYPYTTLTGDVCPVDLSDQTDPAAIDLMRSDNVTDRDKSKPTVELDFHHRLSRIFVKVKAGDGFTTADLKGLSITLSNQPYKADYNVLTDALTTDATANPATKTFTLVTAADGQTASAILLPQDGAAGRVLTFVMADASTTTHTYTLAPDKTFEACKVTEYTIRLSKSGIEVSNASIQPWGKQGEVEDDAEIE